MLQRLRNSQENEKGFTLIELLVVILIIAILAAIAIPVFLRQRQKGWVSQNESALANAALAMEDCSVEADGVYNGLDADGLSCGEATDATLRAHGYRGSDAVTITVAATATTYCIQAVHDDLTAAGHADATMHINNGEDNEPTRGACA